jgi:Holliday junction resolvase
MINSRNNKGLKALVAILALLLAISVFFNFRSLKETKSLTSKFESVKSEKDKVLDSLEVLKNTYEVAISEKTTLSDNLQLEKKKVENLISELKKSKGDATAMASFRKKFNALQENMKSLIAENDILKKSNESLTVQKDSVITVANIQKKNNDTLMIKNETLATKVEKGSKLVVMNLKTQSIKQKSSGKIVETDKASKANKLKISFSIAANEIADSGEKTYYIQVIDSKNNVLGEKKVEEFGEESLTYSFISKVPYENKSVDIVEYLSLDETKKGEEFEKGTYFVNVFDKNVLASKASFALR